MVSSDGFYSRMFLRHAHPLSAWSRLLSTPLLLVPVWTRRWWLFAPIAGWFALNPWMTPPATDMSAFATKAMLGEESWSREPTSEPAILAITAVATTSLAGAMVGAYRHTRAAAVAGTAAFVALTLVEWVLFARRFERQSGVDTTR